MDKVSIEDLGDIRIGYSGKSLGNSRDDAVLKKFTAKFPGKKVYDMPAVGKDHIVKVDGLTPEKVWDKETDALITKDPGILLTLRAADCIPLVFYTPGRKILGLAHVGTSGGALHLPRQMVLAMDVEPSDLSVYVGPHISQRSYRFEIDKFEKKLDQSWDKYISYEADGVHIDLLNYVLDELKDLGIQAQNIKINDVDTGANTNYFSHRRHKLTGEPDGRNCFAACLV